MELKTTIKKVYITDEVKNTVKVLWLNISCWAEIDPVFVASEAHLLETWDKSKLDSALQTETDPVYASDKPQIALKSEIPTVPTNVSSFTNDAGYLTSYNETDHIYAQDKERLDDTSWTNTGDQDLSTFLTGETDPVYSADKSSIALKSEIPVVPTNVWDFVNDVPYLVNEETSIHKDIDWNVYIGWTTNWIKIYTWGKIELLWNATVFDDMVDDAMALQQTWTGISRNVTEWSVEFIKLANLSDYIMKNTQISHRYKLNTTVFPHIHFWQTTSAMPNFLLQYRWQDLAGLKTTAWTNLKCNLQAITYVSWTLNQIARTSAGITPTVWEISDIIQFRIIRDNANTSWLFTGADPVNATVSVVSFDTHFEYDSLGSNDEYTK